MKKQTLYSIWLLSSLIGMVAGMILDGYTGLILFTVCLTVFLISGNAINEMIKD